MLVSSRGFAKGTAEWHLLIKQCHQEGEWNLYDERYWLALPR